MHKCPRNHITLDVARQHGTGSILTLVEDTSGPGVDGIMRWEFLPGNMGYARPVKAATP